MASLLYQQIEGLSREKGIDPQIVVNAVEDAIAVATRKNLKTQETLRGALDKETGAIDVFAVKNVVETPEQIEDPNLQVTLEEARKSDPNVEVGGEVRFHRASHALTSPSGLGRISAQIAKQVIFQKVREAASLTSMDDEGLLASGDHARLLAKYEAVIVARCVAALRGHPDAEDVAPPGPVLSREEIVNRVMPAVVTL